jgi:uncharacterized membrane protein
MDNKSEEQTKQTKDRVILLAGLILLLLLFWLVNTPPGLLGKSDAIGYAICHRISSHSFYFGNRPFSLCARCTGQYLGFLWGFVLQIFLVKRKFGFPSLPILVGMGLLFFLYLVDGLNSFFHLTHQFESWSIYEPLNSLRLFSGLGTGLAISMLLYPLSGQTIWTDYSLEQGSSQFKVWVSILLGAGMLGGLVLIDNPLILYPLILLSTGGVVFLLTTLYLVIWVLIRKRENSFSNWAELNWFILVGFFSGMVQITLIDGIRFLLTGSWSGFLDY